MGVFGGAAGQKAKHGGNRTDNYIDHRTDWGEHVMGLESMVYKEIEKSGKRVVITTLIALFCDSNLDKVDDPTRVIQPGAKRTITTNLADASQRGLIKQQEYKALVTALAQVPLADEQAKDAVLRLVDLTGEDHGLKDLDKAATAALIGARDTLIEVLMEQWTKGEGKKGAGTICLTSVWGREHKDGEIDEKTGRVKVFTSERHKPISVEEREKLREAVGVEGGIPEDLAKAFALA